MAGVKRFWIVAWSQLQKKTSRGNQRPGDHNHDSRMTFTIADDYDPDGEMSPNAKPVTAYPTYLRDVRGGMVGDMGFTLDDFNTYIAGLRKPDWKNLRNRD